MINNNFFLQNLANNLFSVLSILRIKWEDMGSVNWEDYSVQAWDYWTDTPEDNIWVKLKIQTIDTIVTTWENIN